MITISETHYDGDLKEPVQEGPTRKSYPFYSEGDFNSLKIERDYMVRMSTYVPLPLNTPDKEFQQCFLVEETEPKIVGGEVAQFTRIFCAVPRSRSAFEGFYYEFPAISDGPGGVFTYESTSFEPGPDGATIFTIGTTAAFDVDTPIFARYFYDGYFLDAVGNTLSQTIVDLKGRITAKDSTTITALMQNVTPNTRIITPARDPAYIFLQQTASRVVIKGGNFNRAARRKMVSSRVTYDYYLPGISPGVTQSNQIPIFTAFEVVDTSNSETGSSVLSTTTTPTAQEYFEMIASKSEIAPENSVLNRWWGNIIERRSRFVVAE